VGGIGRSPPIAEKQAPQETQSWRDMRRHEVF